MTVALVAKPPQSATMVSSDAGDVGFPANVISLPSLGRTLTAIERYVLARVAVHTWNGPDVGPFVPPNAHQLRVAQALAAPDTRLLLSCPYRRSSFTFSRLGARTARRLFRFVSIEEMEARELEFHRLCIFMRNDWEVSD